MMGVTRRNVVHGLSTAAAWSLLQPAVAMALGSRHFDADPFALGVASGEPTHDGFVLWTRLVSGNLSLLAEPELPVGWEVADDEGFRRIVHRGGALACEPLPTRLFPPQDENPHVRFFDTVHQGSAGA